MTGTLTIDLGTGALPAVVSPVALRISSVDATAVRQEWIGFGAVPFAVNARAIGGTRSAPAATPASLQFNVQQAFGHDGVGYTTTPSIYHRQTSDGLWSATNRGAYFDWNATKNGETVAAEWMRLQNGMLGIGVAPTAGNGLLQFASGTTKANGIAFGTDVNIFRGAANVMTVNASTLQIAAASDTAATFSLVPGGSGQDATVRIGQGGSGNRYAYMSLISDDVYTDYALRVIRLNGGSNTSSAIQHRGTGALILSADDAGYIFLNTSGTSRFTVKPTGQTKFVPLASAPSGAEAGDVYYDSTLSKLRTYTTAWEDLSTGGGAAPSGDVYLRGDATTDGSVRMTSPTTYTAKMQTRVSGTWTDIASFA